MDDCAAVHSGPTIEASLRCITDANSIARGMELGTSVVIATNDRLDLLRRVLRAVRQDPATAEIVVVDDANSDHTSRWLRSCDRWDVPLQVLGTGGAGPGAARQAGVEAASGDLVLLLDDDVIPRPGLVSRHRDLLREHPQRIAVGYSPVSLPARRRAGHVAVFAYARDYERRCLRYESGAAPVTHNLWGGNLGLWRRAAMRVGLDSAHFAERPTFYEDRDFGLRAHRAGLEAVFDRSLRADHHHRRSPAAALADAERRGRSAVRLHRLHGDLIGHYRVESLAAGLPGPGAASLRAARRRRAERIVLPAILAAAGAAGRLRRWEAQDAGFSLARRIREQRGALTAAAIGS
jgi:GT2 family glycosyltransferase